MDSNNNNIYIWKISELSQAVKSTIEDTFDYVRVRGEISKPSFPSSGHIYFSLKDENSLLNAIIWKFSAAKTTLKPEEGLEVICSGKLTTFPGSSRYQIIIQTIEIAGEGALLKQLEIRRKKFLEEGLFDQSNKRKLPQMPKCIGVITSPTGAVIQDILHRITERWPCRVIIAPVSVQGKSATKEIVKAIDLFDKMSLKSYLQKPDIIIIARGGGSVEDLWSFNEEDVVRAVFKSKTPIISAIGHETDTTLIDYVSDKRAPTPTAAAEFATPIRSELFALILENESRMERSLSNIFEKSLSFLKFNLKLFKNPEVFLNEPFQRLDIIFDKLENIKNELFSNKRILLLSINNRFPLLENISSKSEFLLQTIISEMKNNIITRLNSKLMHYFQFNRSFNIDLLESKIKTYENDIEGKFHIIENLFLNRFKNKYEKLSAISRLLEAGDIFNILKRGFILATDKKGKRISVIKDLPLSEELNLIFSDGRASVKITDIEI